MTEQSDESKHARLERLRTEIADIERELHLREESDLGHTLTDEETRLYRTMEQHFSDLLSLHDADGRFIYVSRNCRELFGWSRDELEGTPLDDLIHPDDRERVLPLRERYAGVESEPQSRIRYRMRSKFRGYRWVETRSRIETAPDGSIERIMAVTSDVHARVEAFENLRHFTSIVSHDLRSPMVAIANLARWLGEDVGDLLPEESARHLELLESRIERVLQLLRDLLEYSRIGRKGVTLERVDTGELVASVGEFLSIPDGFTLEIDDEMPVLETSEALLHQVLSNLIHNAVAHHDTDAGTVRVGAVERDGYVFFRVADDGPGIPEAGRHHIFEIFETSHSAEDGEHTGLGLAIVERIVRTVGGGTVEVESPLDEEAGRGTAMIFAWPVRWKLDETILQTGFDEI